MDIYAIDTSGIKDIIDTFSSCIWTMQYFDVNDFELIVPGTERNVDLLTAGTMLVRASDVSNGVYKNVMVVENIELDFDVEKGWQMKVTGGGLKKIVGRRIVWTQTNLSGTVEDGIRRVITENIISPSVPARVIPGFTMTARKGFPDTFEAQLFGDNIAEWLVEVCQQYGYGWDVYIANGGFVFDLYQGTDRTYNQSTVTPVVFSAEQSCPVCRSGKRHFLRRDLEAVIDFGVKGCQFSQFFSSKRHCVTPSYVYLFCCLNSCAVL